MSKRDKLLCPKGTPNNNNINNNNINNNNTLYVSLETDKLPVNFSKPLKDNWNAIKEIFNHWNSKNIIKHKDIDVRLNQMAFKIAEKLQTYSVEELKRAIDNYEVILHGDEYYWGYTWTLRDFMQRGVEKFLDLEVAKTNYKQRNGFEKPKKVGTKYADAGH